MFWILTLVLGGFGALFRFSTRETRFGWLTWLLPILLGAGIYGLAAAIGPDNEGPAVFSMLLFLFGAGALIEGLVLRLKK